VNKIRRLPLLETNSRLEWLTWSINCKFNLCLIFAAFNLQFPLLFYTAFAVVLPTPSQNLLHMRSLGSALALARMVSLLLINSAQDLPNLGTCCFAEAVFAILLVVAAGNGRWMPPAIWCLRRLLPALLPPRSNRGLIG